MDKLTNRIRKWSYRYLMRKGAAIDEGAGSLDTRFALWILQKLAKNPFRKTGKTRRSKAMRNLDDAYRESLEHPAMTETGYIGGQRFLRDIPFGKRGNTADHGCGWISVFNARKLLGNPCCPSEALRDMERGARGTGTRGMDPFYIAKYFKGLGYRTEIVTGTERIENKARECDAFIFCYLFKGRGGQPSGHFVAGKPDLDTGRLVFYNGEQPGESFADSISQIKNQDTFFNLLISIKKKSS